MASCLLRFFSLQIYMPLILKWKQNLNNQLTNQETLNTNLDSLKSFWVGEDQGQMQVTWILEAGTEVTDLHVLDKNSVWWVVNSCLVYIDAIKVVLVFLFLW